jgi:putative ABC transport system permease protein
MEMNDILLQCLIYLPLISGAYISILILRFADLTIEGSWCTGAIVACLFAKSQIFNPAVSCFLGIFAGALCGLLTSIIFVITGRVKLLAGLISFYIIEAMGFHLLGDSARIYLDHNLTRFGYPDDTTVSMIFYFVVSMLVFFIVVYWQKSAHGIRSRLIGENPVSSNFHKISLNNYFSVGLILSNALIGLGGGLWGIYYGAASNAQGIGFLLKAFVALLIGDELIKLLKASNRTIPFSIIVGTFVFVLLSNISEYLQLSISLINRNLWFKPTDKQFFISIVLIMILWFRRRKIQVTGGVSEW